MARSFPATHTTHYKDRHSIVTRADIGADRIILPALRKAFPQDAIFSEEQGLDATTSKNLWVVDPLDGTSNFAHHVPFFAVSICLVQQRRVTLSIIYDPLRKQLFRAVRGHGAFCNGKRIRVGQCTHPQQAYIYVSRGATRAEKLRHGQILQALGTRVRTIRLLGSAALGLALTAAGNFDASIYSGDNFYDIAGGLLMAQEAGASVTDFRGRPWQFTKLRSDALVANPRLAKLLLPTLKRFT